MVRRGNTKRPRAESMTDPENVDWAPSDAAYISEIRSLEYENARHRQLFNASVDRVKLLEARIKHLEEENTLQQREIQLLSNEVKGHIKTLASSDEILELCPVPSEHLYLEEIRSLEYENERLRSKAKQSNSLHRGEITWMENTSNELVSKLHGCEVCFDVLWGMCTLETQKKYMGI